jgi:predicted metal-dependent peptidase
MNNSIVDIDTLKRKMLIKYPFFGSVVANAIFKEEKEIPTAGTDGKNIYYNPDFLSRLEEDEKTFLLAHEICHIAFDHILRSENRNLRLWNIATDAVINQFLLKDGLPLIKGAVDIEEAINYDSETLYEKLLKEQEEKEQEEKEQDNEVGHDTHSYWEEAVNEKNNSESKENLVSQGKNSKENQDYKENNKEDAVKDLQEKTDELGEKESFNKNKELKEKKLKELMDSLSKQASLNSISGVRETRDIGHSKALIDWRLWLRESINIESDWTYQNAEVEYGVVKPNLETYPEPETEIVLDTSGSIDSELLKNFLRECKNIFKNSKVRVGCFDTCFYGFEDVKTFEDIDNLEYKGGGGTDFNVAVDAFTYRVENRIIFTDGEADMPSKPMNIIWIVFGRIKIDPPGGKVIYISEQQLRRLRYIDEETSVKSR